MKVLVVGSGGREHALCWKLSQSDHVAELYASPGNPGIAGIGENISLGVDQIELLVEFAQEKKIDLVVVGPEYPLSLGMSDAFRQAGIRVFGPNKDAAEIESSKVFAKEVMRQAQVPTGGYEVFSTREEAQEYLTSVDLPTVLKADGLAAGKGVFVCSSSAEVDEALTHLFDTMHCSRVVVEEFLEGHEASFIVVTDGEQVIPLASSHDYKRIFDQGQGPNTGGMGTVSPTPHLSAEQEQWVLESVMRPTLRELTKMGKSFCGFLYAGLMISADGAIRVLEFNGRMGDPEGQVILRRAKSDLFPVLYALSASEDFNTPLEWAEESAVCVVLASGGYPQSSSKGDVISGIEQAEVIPGCVVFHAGTAVDLDGQLATAGGRVLNITALGSSIAEARTRAYQAADMIQFKGRQLRRDIAAAL